MLVNVRTIAVDERRQRRKVLARMEARLSGDFNAGTVEPWNRVDKSDVEAELAREHRFLSKPLGFFLRISVQGRELVARHPRPMTVDRLVLDDGIDLGNRGETRIPDGLRV